MILMTVYDHMELTSGDLLLILHARRETDESDFYIHGLPHSAGGGQKNTDLYVSCVFSSSEACYQHL